MTATRTIPVVDLADSFSGDLLKRRAVAVDIARAAADTGFFYVRNHGVPPAIVERQLDTAARFFARDLDAKMDVHFAKKGGYLGYEGMKTQTLDLEAPADLKESYMAVYENPPPDADAEMNQWPADMPAFKDEMLDYAGHMVRLGRHLAACLALSLDLPETYFAPGFVRPNCSVRILRYPPHPADAEKNQLGCGAHTDWGFITILLQDGSAGLEVQDAAGDWRRAPPIDGTFVVNLGDMIPRLTDERYHSNMHRVLNNISGKARYSCASFFNPSAEYIVDCVPTCLPASGVAKHPPCSAKEHIDEMFRNTYGRAG